MNPVLAALGGRLPQLPTKSQALTWVVGKLKGEYRHD